MTVPGNLSSPLLATAADAAAAAFQISRSLRFSSGDSGHLSRTPSSAGNRRTWSWSGWVKKAKNEANQVLFSSGSGGTNARSILQFTDTDIIEFGENPSGSSWSAIYTNAVFIDPGAWYHIVAVYDSTNATSADRLRLYVNGDRIDSFSSTSYPSENLEGNTNTTDVHRIGRYAAGNEQAYLDGYLAEVNFLDGIAVSNADDFGQYDDNNVWQPKQYSGNYGTNGFRLSFADNTSTTTISEDSSGNNNDWTANNISVTAGSGNDSLIDTPSNYTSDSGNNGGNYCTLNPLQSATTLSNGNLDSAGGSGWSGTAGTFGMSSGKWYFEYDNVVSNEHIIGIVPSTTYTLNTLTAYAYGSETGGKYDPVGGSNQSYGNSWTTGDVIGVAFDADNGNLYFYKNGTVQNSGTAAFTGLTSGPYLPSVVQNGSSRSASLNFGQRPFAYTPPTGYVSLCTQNLPDPTIADGSTAFEARTYDGVSGASSQTGFNFGPDFVWIKRRNSTNNHTLTDSVRGAGYILQSHNTNAEIDNTAYFTGFTSDGFSFGTDGGDTDAAGGTYVAWAWDAGANSSKTYTVKVVSDSGNKYRFDDFGTSAVTLDLEEGSTYVFDQSDSSNSGHPLRFSTTSDGTHGSGSEYTTGVTATGTPGSAGAKTTIVVAASAPTLYYYCSAHSGMGGQANTNSTAGASNFDGSIQSTVRANQTAGFSIIKHTGSGTNPSSIGHGLNSAPVFYITKSRDSSTDWVVSTTVADGTHDFLDLNNTQAIGAFDAGLPTSSVFYVSGSTTNASGDDYVTYCWTPVAGYSAFGTYSGNGSADGPFVFTGHRSQFLLVKQSSASGEDWWIVDTARETFNVQDQILLPNSNNSEITTSNPIVDILSNGFKLRNANARFNGSGATYLFASFASHPFKTARAR